MTKRLNVTGYEEFLKTLRELDAEKEPKQVNIYFFGEKNEQGVSWCPDCNNADPHIRKAMEEFADKDSVFLEVNVGDRTTWKDPTNRFRTDKDVMLTSVPTLLRWKSVIRLNDSYCANMEVLELFFKAEKDSFALQ